MIYFVYAVFYSLFFAIGGFFYKGQKEILKERSSYKYLILVPGYKEDGVIVETAQKNCSINYPSDHFDLEIIADSFEDSTLELLKQLPMLTEANYRN